MGEPALKLEPAKEVVHDFATVVAIDKTGALVVESEWGRREARRASSCLLEPNVGDRVLVAERGAEGYVLEVLSARSASRVSVEGDLEIVAPNGRLALRARDGVQLLASRAIELLGSALKVNVSDAELSMQRLAYSGKEAAVDASAVKVVLGALTSFADRVEQHVKRSLRTVEETDQLRAKRVDYRSEEETILRARHAFVQAAELVKMTGEQIHMG
ncbi:MAG: DUF3540 domain-containing protein [Sandaracinaceae bacterium]|nr:DUF3540 domain-containing protein [Sandaracinaceae bacterium]